MEKNCLNCFYSPVWPDTIGSGSDAFRVGFCQYPIDQLPAVVDMSNMEVWHYPERNVLLRTGESEIGNCLAWRGKD